MEELTVTEAKYIVNPDNGQVEMVRATIDGTEMFVPLDPANRHYAEIMRQVNEGTLVIQPAEENN